ncbi:YwiC-like family protein [Paenibacillus crassostreae]
MKNNIVIPHEHGGWAMVSVPFIIGMLAGHPSWMHVLLFLAWLFLYLASYPFLQALKKRSKRGHLIKWGITYSVIAVLCVLVPLVKHPELFYFAIPLVCLLLVNIWHVKRKAEREMLNDLCALLIFALGGAAAYLIGDGGWDRTMVWVILFNFIYFIGTVFFVKTVFRKRGNQRWFTASRIYHILLLIIPWIVGLPWMTLAYVFALVRAFIYGGKQIRPMKVGILEVVGAVYFLVVTVIVIQMKL